MTDEPNQTQSGHAQPKDPLFKRLIQDYFELEKLTDIFAVTPGVQVGQLQLEIDLTVTALANLSQEEVEARLAKTPFWFFNRHNLIEFKSISDPLGEADFARITARASLAWAERPQGIAGSELVSCIISAAQPRNLLKTLKPGGRKFRQIRPGIFYHPGFLFPIYLVVCNLLPVEEDNFPLLVFSSGKKLQEYLQKLVDLNLKVYLNYAVRLHPVETNRLLRENSMLTSKQKNEIYQTMLDKLGDKGVIELIIQMRGIEHLVEVIGQERLAEAIGPERLAEMLKLQKPEEAPANQAEKQDNAAQN